MGISAYNSIFLLPCFYNMTTRQIIQNIMEALDFVETICELVQFVTSFF